MIPTRAARTILAAFATVLAASGPLLGGVSIPIVNHGFEGPVYQLCAFGAATGWTPTGGSGGAWRPGAASTCGTHFGGPVPEGSQIGFINGSAAALVQTLGATLQPNTKYQLTVEVGRRADGYGFVDYRIELRAGDIVIAEDPGLLDPALGTFETSTVCAEIGASHPALGQPLQIRLMVIGGVQTNYDDVRLVASAPDGQCEQLEGGPVGDLDGNGVVDGADLGILLGSWGPCPECLACPADLDGDCAVGGGDLGLLLGNWG